MSIIEVRNVSKQFKDVMALKNVNITFGEGKIYGLLGRNGAGKSTLLNVITNRLFPTEGEVYIDGERTMENDKVLSKIFCMSEKTLYPETMKVKEAFKWSAEFYPDFDMEYAKNLSEKFELKLNKKIKGLSTGYTSIFKMIIALSCNAPIIFLDEPVLGLDANHRDMFYKELLASYSENPKTYVISTHLIEEVADVIEDVVIIDDGKVIMQDEVSSILKKGYTVSGKASLIDSYISNKQVLGTDTMGGLKTAYIYGELKNSEIPSDIEVSKMNLQKFFVQLTSNNGGTK